jgi:AcrR family transcriptional regulator
MRRTKEEAAVTRARLLDAALESFHAKGYAATTLDDIAHQAGITRGAIQWHFGNKAELYNILISESYQKAGTAFREIYEAEGTPLQKFRLILIKWLGYAEEDAQFRTMLELIMLKTEISPELAGGLQQKTQGNQATIAFFAAIIRGGIQAGEIRLDVHPEVTAIAALGLVNGITSLWLIDPTIFSLRDSAAETVEIFLRGIART